MKVVVTGGTGLVGSALVPALVAGGHRVTVLSRSSGARLPAGVRVVPWSARPPEDRPDPAGAGAWWRALDGADAVVHLAGESIAARRWSPAQKERIRESRVRGTRAVVAALERAARRPAVLVSGSAVGYYGDGGDRELTEEAGPGSDFLARVCVAWEGEARRAEALGLRVVLLRTGMVLAQDGGALPRMLLPFRLFLGGPLGSGAQWMSWIHRDDLVGLIRFLLEMPDARGPFNGVAPRPVTNREFSRVAGRVLGRPSWLPAPPALLRLALGEMADALLLAGQRAVPARALALGYRFRYAELEPALRAVLGRPAG